ALDFDGIGLDRLGSRGVKARAGTDVETRAVQPAFDLAAFHVPFGQRNSRVGALVVDRPDIVAVADQSKLDTLDFYADDAPVGDVIDVTSVYVHAHSSAAKFFCSSSSTVLTRRSSMAGTLILRMSS